MRPTGDVLWDNMENNDGTQSNFYSYVDEEIPDGDSTYNVESDFNGSGGYIIYSFDSMFSGHTTINYIDIYTYFRGLLYYGNGGVISDYKTRLYINSEFYDYDTLYVKTSCGRATLYNNPYTGGKWTIYDINNLKTGGILITDIKSELGITTYYVEVDYSTVSESKSVELTSADYVKDSEHISWEYTITNRMFLSWTANDTNEVYTAAGWYGDGCASQRSIETDGDLVLSIGWNDGFAIRRINDNGTLTNIYYDNNPIAGYTYYNNIALDKTNHKVYVGSYNYDGLVPYDYSGCLPTGTTVTKESMIHPTYDRCGYAYMNGIQIVGDYLYLHPSEVSTSICRRYNLSTSSQDDLTVINRVYNGRYGQVWYDEDNNRIYILNRTDGGLWVVINPEKPSTDANNPAKCYAVNIYSFGVSNDMSTPGISVDKHNKNHLWLVGYYGRYVKVDITNVLDGTDTVPTLLDRNDVWYDTYMNQAPFYNNYYMSMRDHPTLKSDLSIITPSGSYNIYYGWFDKEDKLPVISGYYSSYESDGTLIYRYNSEDMVGYSYAPFPVRVQSSGGTYYWVFAGYSLEGYRFRVYDDDTSGLTMHKSGYIIFGDFQLDSHGNIGKVQITNLKDFVHEPTDCSFDVKVSNNSGTDWEVYDWSSEEYHIFSTTGNTLQVKYELTGYMGVKSPYIMTLDYSKMTISFTDEIETSTTSKKLIRKIKGAKT